MTVRPTSRRIADIRIGKRHRKDLGDIPGLAANIAAIGALLHPVVIRPDGTLIAGERRLAACKILGWSEVPVHVVDIDAIARGELAENAYRKDFTPSELVAIAATVERRERELARQRMSEGGKVGKLSTPSKAGKTRDKVATPLGVSGRTLEKARAVVQAAQREPERFGSLVLKMDRTGKVNAAHRELRRTEDEKRILALAPVAGKFKTQLIDWPWQYDMDFLGRGKPDYATMTQEELLAFAPQIADWAEDNCHLYFCAPNAMLPKAFALMTALERFGFRYNTAITWKKPRYGLGTHFRGQTEHVLFAIRGVLATRRNDIPTWFEAPVGEHSEKPERLYEIVRTASYPPYGEAFQRKPRPDFVNLFQRISEAAE